MVFSPGILFPVALGGHIHLAADNWLDTGRTGLLVKFDGAEHIPMIRHGQSRHSESGRLLNQFVDRVGAIQEAVMGMTMQMNEIGMLHGVRMWSRGLNWRYCNGKSMESQSYGEYH